MSHNFMQDGYFPILSIGIAFMILVGYGGEVLQEMSIIWTFGFYPNLMPFMFLDDFMGYDIEMKVWKDVWTFLEAIWNICMNSWFFVSL